MAFDLFLFYILLRQGNKGQERKRRAGRQADGSSVERFVPLIIFCQTIRIRIYSRLSFVALAK